MGYNANECACTDSYVTIVSLMDVVHPVVMARLGNEKQRKLGETASFSRVSAIQISNTRLKLMVSQLQLLEKKRLRQIAAFMKVLNCFFLVYFISVQFSFDFFVRN